MKNGKGIMLGAAAAAVSAGMVYAFNCKNLKSGRKKAMKWLSKTARNIGETLQDFSYNIR